MIASCKLPLHVVGRVYVCCFGSPLSVEFEGVFFLEALCRTKLCATANVHKHDVEIIDLGLAEESLFYNNFSFRDVRVGTCTEREAAGSLIPKSPQSPSICRL